MGKVRMEREKITKIKGNKVEQMKKKHFGFYFIPCQASALPLHMSHYSYQLLAASTRC